MLKPLRHKRNMCEMCWAVRLNHIEKEMGENLRSVDDSYSGAAMRKENEAEEGFMEIHPHSCW